MSGINIIIIAAGEGKRMKSPIPKVLHKIAGRTMLGMIYDSVKSSIGGKNYNIVSVVSKQMLSEYNHLLDKDNSITYVEQKERLGTGHAVMAALSHLNKNFDKTIILYGDTPNVQNIISGMLNKSSKSELVITVFKTVDLTQKYGRIITDKDLALKCVEFADANEEEKAISTCMAGMMCVKTDLLIDLVPQIKNHNAQKEYYLVDIIEIANSKGKKVHCYFCDESEAMGINSQSQLHEMETIVQNNLRQKHINNGVFILNPNTVFFSYDTVIESFVSIEQNVIFGSNVIIGSGCKIASNVNVSNSKVSGNTVVESNVLIRDSDISVNSLIRSFSYIEGLEAKNVVIGPFARIRPSTILDEGSIIGNFVEVKNSNIGKETKVTHLSYVGDAQIGKNCNIGAGFVICNYDGFKKNRTTIGDGAFLGSNSALVAPINIGSEALIAAGSVITGDVEDGCLAVSRSEQKNIKNGARRYRLKKSDNKNRV